jgi:hypothetical protein
MEIISDDSPRRSSLSFSLRGLLVVMLIAAVVCIAIGPFVRSLIIEQRRALALVVTAATIGATLIVALAVWGRRRVERRSGQLACSLSERGAGVLRWLWVIVFMSQLLPFVFMTKLFLSNELRRAQNPTSARFSNNSHQRNVFAFVATSQGLAFGMCAVWVWFGPLVGSVEFCANGIAWRAFRFAPWRNVCVRRWDQVANQLTLSLNNRAVTLNIPPDEWPMVRDVLQAHVDI